MNALRLKEIRKELGLTQTEFAKTLDFHLRTVQKWESGEIKMRKNNILAIQNLYSKSLNLEEEDAVENDIEVLYAEHVEFKNALSVIRDQGFKAYEIHKQTGLNESGIRRVLNKEVENPQRKTRKGLIKFANSIAHKEKDMFAEKEENVDFRDLKIDDKLNVIFNQLQTLQENKNAIASIKEDIAFNNEIICKTDRALNLYTININSIIKKMKEDNSKVIKLG